MTTTYKTIEFDSAETLREAINSELAALAYPYSVKHKTYGEGQLISVKVPLAGPDLLTTVDFPIGTKTFSLDTVFANKLFEMPEILSDILFEAQTTYKTDFTERENEHRIASTLAREQLKEAQRKAEADKKAEEKYEKLKAKALADFETRADSVLPKSTADEFYYSLGWLAKHVGSISAKLPDYLANAFTKHFGTDAAFNAIDSKKRTSNGNAMQWTFGFTATLRKPENIPAILTKHLSSSENKIADTAFIWDLVDNYGFKFSKAQDIDEIRSHVPSDKLSFFEAGLA